MNRAEWLQERQKGIGASDAAAIIGVSPWKSNQELWMEKTGRKAAEDIGDKSYVRYGNDAEPLLRELFRLDYPEYEVSYEPYKIIRCPTKPFIFATPDGELLEIATGRRGGLEIKTTEILNSTAWLKWKDRIPEEYYTQVLHQMLATGWEFVVLKAQIKHRDRDGTLRIDTRHYFIERIDVEEDLLLVEQEDTKFWESVEKDKKPNLKLPII